MNSSLRLVNGTTHLEDLLVKLRSKRIAEYLENLDFGLRQVVKKLKKHGVRVVTIDAQKADFMGDKQQLDQLATAILE